MEKQIITFSANEQKLIKTGGIECYASNIVSYIEAHFDLGANWSGYDSVRAVWSNDNNMSVISTVLDSNGICVVPFEVLKTKGVVKVNLVGSISVSDVLTDRLTSYPCEAVKVTAKAKIEGSETQPITPSQFEQFVAVVRDEVAEVTGMSAEATTLPAGSSATASYSDGVLSLGIPKGDKGDKGDTGETGAPAGFGTVSATVDDTIGTPSVEVTASGADTAKNFAFAFHNLKGQKGDKGDTGEAGGGAVGTVASAYSASKTYAVGDYAIHNSNLYRCTTAITTAEAFTAAHWTQVVLADDVSDLKSEIDEISTIIETVVDVGEITATYMATNGTEQSGAYHAEISVVAGEKYKIKSSDGSNVKAYVLVSNGSVVDYYSTVDSWATLHDYDIEYTVPQDGTLCVNSIDNLYIGAKKVELVPLYKANSDKNTKARADALQLNESKNLYNGEYITGGYRSGRYITAGSEYCYSEPIYLEAGTYLYTSTYKAFGAAGCVVYVVDQSGGIYITSKNISTTSVGTVSEYQKYNNRRIDSFTLSEACYVSFNIGRPTSNIYEDQANNFMLVKGSTLADFPHYEPYYAPFYSVKDEDINGLSGLRGKIAIFDGDSICQGSSVGASEPTYLFGYAGRVGKANDMIWKNYGVGGGCITSATNPSIGSSRHSVVDNIDTLYAQFPDADFIIFEGGTNDADLLGDAIADPTKMGTFTENDYAGTYDITTFSGALETILYKAVQYWKGKKIGFVVAQKMGYAYTKFDKDHANRRAYFERAIEICKKWGVPCLNLWDGCYLNPKNASCYNSSLDADGNIEQGYLYIDGQHLTAKGYDYISPIIENWMKSL